MRNPRKGLRDPAGVARERVTLAAWTPLIFYLTCPPLYKYGGAGSRHMSGPLPRGIASFVADTLLAGMVMCTSLIMRTALEADRTTIDGHGMGTGSDRSHRLRHDKVVICWQLKVLLIVQLIDIIN